MNFLNRCSTVSSMCVLRRVNQFSFGQRFQNSLTCVSIHHKNDRNNLYPTHQVFVRGFGSSCITNSSNSDDKKGIFSDKTVISLSNTYSFKLLYYLILHDKNIKYHVGKSFADGAKMAFLYTTECLVEKNFKGLSEVVSPELLHEVENLEVNKKNSESVHNVAQLKLMGISWEYDQFTKEKNLEVDVRFAFLTPADAEKKSLFGDVKFAIFRFHRTYGDERKDSQWTVTDFKYLTNMFEFVKLRDRKK